jgi:hypothetical protein
MLSPTLVVQTTNQDVKKLGLEKFQEWALSFRSKPELSYVNDVYVSMQHEGTLSLAISSLDPSCSMIADLHLLMAV